MEELVKLLPLLIPLIIVQYSLWGYALYHILTHKTYKRGSRALWLCITLILSNFVGPILYLALGREST